jgi:hypothetical protein
VTGFLLAIRRAEAVRALKTLNLLIVGTRGSEDQIKKLARVITSEDER